MEISTACIISTINSKYQPSTACIISSQSQTAYNSPAYSLHWAFTKTVSHYGRQCSLYSSTSIIYTRSHQHKSPSRSQLALHSTASTHRLQYLHAGSVQGLCNQKYIISSPRGIPHASNNFNAGIQRNISSSIAVSMQYINAEVAASTHSSTLYQSGTALISIAAQQIYQSIELKQKIYSPKET